MLKEIAKEKLSEVVKAIVPIVAIVLILQVLANQVQSIPNSVLIMSVSGGVAFFLVMALLRMVVGIPLQRMLLFFYVIAFVLAYYTPRDFLAVAFDSGGVTTGPMTVPFIMAFGVGVSALRGTKHSSQDSFGLIALCSIGPIISVLLLGLIFRPENATYEAITVPKVLHSMQLGGMFMDEIPNQVREIAQAVVPIAIFFAIFQTILLHLEKKALVRITNGIFFTFIGLVLFLTGANVGFIPAGFDLGSILAAMSYNWIIVPIGMLIGYFIIKAEPAVYVLMKQVEDITDGAISGQALRTGYGAGIDRDSSVLYADSGVCDCAAADICCASDFYGHCFRFRRRGVRSHDSDLFTSFCHGRLHDGGRQCGYRCLWGGDDGCDDAVGCNPVSGTCLQAEIQESAETAGSGRYAGRFRRL